MQSASPARPGQTPSAEIQAAEAQHDLELPDAGAAAFALLIAAAKFASMKGDAMVAINTYPTDLECKRLAAHDGDMPHEGTG